MEKLRQTADDLNRHLQEQVEFIIASAERFDEGHIAESKRIALAIRVLVHDTPNSVSLLRQLATKEELKFHDTSADYDPRNLASSPGLLIAELGTSGAGWIAPLDFLPPPMQHPKVPFQQWWDKIVLPVNREILLTRRDLVLAVAQQDGGAHVDPSLEKRYAEITRWDSMGWKFLVNGIEQDFRNPVLVSIRQIGHEMLKTIKDGYPELPVRWPARSRHPKSFVGRTEVLFGPGRNL